MLYKAYGILKDYTLAEDAASEAFIRIYKNSHKISDPDSKMTIAYLVTIVKNISLTMLKKEQTHVNHSVEELIEYGEELENDYCLEEEIFSQLSEEKIYKMIDSLKEEYRSVFLLKYGQDFSHKQIANCLDISENNVTVRLHRAKTALQKLMIKEGYINEKRRSNF